MEIGIDVIALGVIVLFFIRGMLRGFTLQLAGAIAFVAGLFVAKKLAPQIQPWIGRWLGEKATATNHLDLYASYFAVFLVFLVIVTIILYMLRAKIRSSKLASSDRLLGGVLGLAVGVLVVIVVVLAGSHFLPERAEATLGGSYTAKYTYEAVERLTPLFPEKIHERVAKYIGPGDST